MAVCVGCGLAVDTNGVLNVDLADDVAGDHHSGLDCNNTTGLSLAIQNADTDSIIINGNGTFSSPLSATVSVDTQNSTSINWTGGREGTAALPLQAQVTRSPDACNGLELRANGVWAKCPSSLVQIMNVSPAFAPFGINSGGAGNFNIPSGCNNSCNGGNWHICNPYNCQISGFISIRAYMGAVSGASVGFDAEGHLEVSINGGGYTGASPGTFIRMQNLTVNNQSYWDLANMEERNFLILDPGACVDYQVQATINVFAGTATWSTGPNFEYYVHLTTTGGCS